MNGHVLGVINVFRPAFGRMIFESLCLTQDTIVVVRMGGVKSGLMIGAVSGTIEGVLQYKDAHGRKAEQYGQLSVEDMLKADKNNYTIPNSEIAEVELKRYGRGAELNIKTSVKHGKSIWGETKWVASGLWKDVGEKYENMLRPIFKDRLVVKK